MVRTAALAIAAIASTSALAQGPVDDPAMIWALDNAGFGVDVTPDGRLWANLNAVGQEDDYAILITDVLKSDGKYPTAWIRGYHKRNPKVSYRTTMTRYSFHCADRTMWTMFYSEYSAEGKQTLSREGSRYQASTIVPGTIGEHWMEVACKIK